MSQPEPIQSDLPPLSKQEVLDRIQLLIQNNMAVQADKLRRDYKHILAPEIPLGAQRWLSQYITTNKYMVEVKHKIGLASKEQDTLLINGPTGSGKELLANALHGDRRADSFVSVNCAGLPSGLIESELFGHVKGAFTGATEKKDGLFTQAEGGTIFLDEIGELPLEVQAKLLRVIQEKQIRLVGGNTNRTVNVRIVCATHQNLEKLVEAGKFREDLYWRINTLSVKVTGLDERPLDIPPIVDYWASKFENDPTLKINIKQRFPRDFIINPTLLTGNVRSIISIIRKFHIWGELPAPTSPELED